MCILTDQRSLHNLYDYYTNYRMILNRAMDINVVGCG